MSSRPRTYQNWVTGENRGEVIRWTATCAGCSWTDEEEVPFPGEVNSRKNAFWALAARRDQHSRTHTSEEETS